MVETKTDAVVTSTETVGTDTAALISKGRKPSFGKRKINCKWWG